MDNYIINVVSYKRPNNTTCKLLNKTNLNWRVFIYQFDPYINDYLNKYSGNVYVISQMKQPNLSQKRQLTLDVSIKENYQYCFMLDDDILEMTDTIKNQKITIVDALNILYKEMKRNNLLAISASYNRPKDNNFDIELNKCVSNNTIFDLFKYQKTNVKYNSLSKCEDMEFTIELILSNNLIGRTNKLLVKNDLRLGNSKKDNGGLSYRFSNKERFIEEGSYICNKFPHLKEAFEYDEKHFKLKSDKLMEILKNEN